MCLSACSVKQEAPVAICENGVLAFKGIPYAKAPVGELRWKAPQPVEASDATFEAKEYGLPGLQSYDEGEVASHGELSEDCLKLNVWTTDLNMQKGRPVMVWIHGGSYGWGGTADPMYEGKFLPAEYPDVVMVTIEYRVNAMGFSDFSKVPGGEAFTDSPNLGILDQQQALRWIKNNISAFGGDPDNVTIFGESAGGTGRTYMYYFKKGYDKGIYPGQDFMKACHSCEVTYAFNNLEYKNGGPFDPELTKKFSNIFVNFARTGNPSIEGLDVPQYEKTNRSTIVVDRDCSISVVDNPNPKQTELLLPSYYDFYLKKN